MVQYSEVTMGWLRLAGSIKLQVSFAKEPYKRDDILQKRPVILSILLTAATPYQGEWLPQVRAAVCVAVYVAVCVAVCVAVLRTHSKRRRPQQVCVAVCGAECIVACVAEYI